MTAQHRRNTAGLAYVVTMTDGMEMTDTAMAVNTQTELNPQTSDYDAWRELAQQFRVDSIRVAANANSGHPTSSMSAAELMSVLVSKYFRYRVDEPKSTDNDHLIFSKGHASPLYYSILLAIGAIDERGDGDLPTQGQPPRRPPDAGPALRRRRNRVARPGAAGRSRCRARRQAARPARLPDVDPVRRQRDGRGLDLGGARPGELRATRQPDRDHRRQPPGPDRADALRVGPRPLRRPDPRLRLARDRDRRPRRRGGRPAYAEAVATKGKPTAIVAADDQGQGRVVGGEQERLPRQARRRRGGRDPRAGRPDATSASRRRRRDEEAKAHTFDERRAEAADLRAGHQGRHAQGVRRRARGDRRGRRQRSSRSTARSATRPTPRPSPTSSPSASSRCTSPSSR